MKNKTIEDLEALVSLGNFMRENKKAGQLTKEQSDKIEKLVLEYRIITPSVGDCLLTADFGTLGSIIIREIKKLNMEEDEGFELSYMVYQNML